MIARLQALGSSDLADAAGSVPPRGFLAAILGEDACEFGPFFACDGGIEAIQVILQQVVRMVQPLLPGNRVEEHAVNLGEDLPPFAPHRYVEQRIAHPSGAQTLTGLLNRPDLKSPASLKTCATASQVECNLYGRNVAQGVASPLSILDSSPSEPAD